jgi:hypothetical protein
MQIEVVERVGDFPSPTVLTNPATASCAASSDRSATVRSAPTAMLANGW